MLAAGHSLLIVSTEPGRIRAHLMAAARVAGALDVAHLEPDEVFAMGVEGGCALVRGMRSDFDAALIIVDLADCNLLRELVCAVDRLLMDGAQVVLALSDLSDSNARPITPADVELVTKQVGSGLRGKRIETVPTPSWRIAWQGEMMMRMRAAMRARGKAARLRHLAVGIACAGLSLLANVACLRCAERGRPGPCSTILLHFVRRRRSPSADPAPGGRQLADAWTA